MATALVTGASRGIGREVARQLAHDGLRVLLGVRDPASAPRLPGASVEVLDVADPASIEGCAALLQRAGVALDLLVNNAGVYQAPARQVWDTNLRGPLLLVRALRPLLAPDARVVNVTSGLGALSSQPAALQRRLTDTSLTEDDLLALCEERPGGYGATKAALNAFTRLLAAQGQRACAVDPGWVQTDMGGRGAPRTLEQGAASVLWACRLGPDGPSGVFRDGRAIAW
jgi:NAD(P)-dependent dehydrogenase (short-subunit alcohol dehydrogenase family)